MTSYNGHKFNRISLYNGKYSKEEFDKILKTQNDDYAWYKADFYECLICGILIHQETFGLMLNDEVEMQYTCEENQIKNLLE